MDTTTFLNERKYLMNVSEATLTFYEQTFQSVLKHGDFTEEGLKRWVIGSRVAGNAPRSINTRITGINAYLKWKGEVHRVQKLKCANESCRFTRGSIWRSSSSGSLKAQMTGVSICSFS